MGEEPGLGGTGWGGEAGVGTMGVMEGRGWVMGFWLGGAGARSRCVRNGEDGVMLCVMYDAGKREQGLYIQTPL